MSDVAELIERLPLGALTIAERHALEPQLVWVACPQCEGASYAFTGGEFCPVCNNQGRLLQSTVNILSSFLPFYQAQATALETLQSENERLEAALRNAHDALQVLIVLETEHDMSELEQSRIKVLASIRNDLARAALGAKP